MKYTWNIRFLLKNGKQVEGKYRSQHEDSSNTIRSIIELLDAPGNQWLTIEVTPNCVETVLLNDVVSIQLWFD